MLMCSRMPFARQPSLAVETTPSRCTSTPGSAHALLFKHPEGFSPRGVPAAGVQTLDGARVIGGPWRDAGGLQLFPGRITMALDAGKSGPLQEASDA